MQLIKRYYLLFLSVNIFLPKIDLGIGSFYVFELINVFVLLLLLSRGRLFLKSIVIQTYMLFILVSLISFFVGVLTFNFFDFISFIRVLKFGFFTLYLIIPYYIYRDISREELRRVLHYQFLFFVAAGSYVVFNMVTNPKSISSYIWEYDNRYRLIGFTGYSLDWKGNIEMTGSTSVSMGVFVAFVFLIYLSLYRSDKKQSDLVKVLLLVVLELLTYSRAGIVVMLTGLLYYVFLNVNPKLILKWFFGVTAVVIIFFSVNFYEQLSSFGTFSKIFQIKPGNDTSVNIRINMLTKGLEYIADNPHVLLIGAGYGEAYTQEAIKYNHLEGLIPTTIFTSGLLAALLLIVHFFFLWRQSRDASTGGPFRPFAYGLLLFIPGWFLSIVMAGNTFQTDFYFPLIYFVFFCCYLSYRDERKEPVTGHPA